MAIIREHPGIVTDGRGGGSPAQVPPGARPGARATGHPSAPDRAPEDISKVRELIKRCEAALRPYEPKIHETLAFFDNEQYAEVFADGKLDFIETREGGTKPRHRPRLTRNRYTPAILKECAGLAGRIPVYEVTAATGDPSQRGSAKLSEKALLAQYEARDVKGLALDTLQYAHITGAGFTWPYWDAGVGGFIEDPQTGKQLRTGEIGAWVLHAGEVMWQPGREFYDSRIHIVRKAQHVDDIMARPDYRGPAQLKPNAMSATFEARRGEEARDLAMVYHVLERPSEQHPQGRWLQVCQNELIAEPRPYPREDDVCALEWIPYIRRRHRQLPIGLGELMLDIQRTYNRTINQIVSYKNLVLVPQVFAPVGSMRKQLDDTPGAIWEYRPIGGQRPEWREMPDLPVGLFRVLDQCIADWQEITGQNSLPAGLESGSGVQAVNERDQERRAVMVSHLARYYSGLGKQFLYLMQKHYTEDRLLSYRGRFGIESIADFRGTKLHLGEVRVAEGSVAPRTRAAQQAIIMNLVDRGLVPHEKAIHALNAGTAEVLIDSYELDEAKQQEEIRQFIAMGTMEAEEMPMVDPMVDEHGVHVEVLRMWMKTPDFRSQPEMVQEAARAHLGWHIQEQQVQAFQAQLASGNAAEQLGRENAARPQGGAQGHPAGGAVAPAGSKPMPSQPSVASSREAAADAA